QRRVRRLRRPRREEDAAHDHGQQGHRGDRLLPAREPGQQPGRAPAEIDDLLAQLGLRRAELERGAHQVCIRMMSLKALTAWLRTATVSSVASDAWVA